MESVLTSTCKKLVAPGSFLEQLKGIVVVQNVDGVRQGEQLLGLSLADLGPLFLLGGAGLLQPNQELFVLIAKATEVAMARVNEKRTTVCYNKLRVFIEHAQQQISIKETQNTCNRNIKQNMTCNITQNQLLYRGIRRNVYSPKEIT